MHASHIKHDIFYWILIILLQNNVTVPRDIIGDIQRLLLTLMCNIAKMCFCKNSSGVTNPDQTEQKQRCFFVNAAIAFCKVQHIDLTVPMKSQVSWQCKS